MICKLTIQFSSNNSKEEKKEFENEILHIYTYIFICNKYHRVN